MTAPATFARRLLLPFPAPLKRLGVAVSGGADSVALLRLLHALPDHCRPHLIVIHVDHAVRPESRDDARWVERLAASLGHPCRSIRLRPSRQRAFGQEGGFEAWARDRRLAFFARLTREEQLDAIALGHHAGDQAETLLLRLIRGASLPGLGGMRPWQRLRIDGTCLRLWRPLLGTGRSELQAFLRELPQDWREDSSNTDPRFLRNLIRSELLPLLERIRSGAADRLAATACELGEVQATLARRAGRLRRKYNPPPRLDETTPSPHVPEAPCRLTLPTGYGRTVSPSRLPLLRELLRQWLCRIAPPLAERLDRHLMGRLVDLVRNGGSGRAVEFGHHRIVRTRQGLELT